MQLFSATLCRPTLRHFTHDRRPYYDRNGGRDRFIVEPTELRSHLLADNAICNGCDVAERKAGRQFEVYEGMIIGEHSRDNDMDVEKLRPREAPHQHARQHRRRSHPPRPLPQPHPREARLSSSPRTSWSRSPPKSPSACASRSSSPQPPPPQKSAPRFPRLADFHRCRCAPFMRVLCA